MIVERYIVLHVRNAQLIRVGLSYRANDVAKISKFCEVKDRIKLNKT